MVNNETAIRQVAIVQEFSSPIINAPWKKVFPDLEEAGYSLVFKERCKKLGYGSIDESKAKEVWLGILKEYEDYQLMGMWIPDDPIQEHREVARRLGWL